MAANMTDKELSHYVNFRFEYALEPKKHELEGKSYIGIGVSAKMVDTQGNEVIERIQNITSDPGIAQKLIYLLNLSKVSPMCLKMFVEDFLATD